MEEISLDDLSRNIRSFNWYYTEFLKGVVVSEGNTKSSKMYHHVSDYMRSLGIEFEGKYRDSTHLFPSFDVYEDSDGRERVKSAEDREYFVKRINGKIYLSDAGSPQPRVYLAEERIEEGKRIFTVYSLNKHGMHNKKPLKKFSNCNYIVDSQGKEIIYETRERDGATLNYDKYEIERADDGKIYLRPAKRSVDEKELVYEVEGDINAPNSYQVYKLRKNEGYIDDSTRFRVFQYSTPDGNGKAKYKIKRDSAPKNPIEHLLLGHVLESLKAQNGDEAIDVWSRILMNSIIKGAEPNLSVISFYESLPDSEHVKAFEKLLNFILDRQPIQFDYYSKNSQKTRHVYMHPYMLKNYNQRWYLIGRELASDCDPNNRLLRYRNDFSFDKKYPVSSLAIDGINPRGQDGTIPDTIEMWDVAFVEWGVKPVDYFDELIGVTPDIINGPQKAILRFNRSRFQYVSSKPIAMSQKEIKPGEKYYDAERPTISITVHFNREFTQQILSFGQDVEVIYPEELRAKIAQTIKSMSDIYKSQAEPTE